MILPGRKDEEDIGGGRPRVRIVPLFMRGILNKNPAIVHEPGYRCAKECLAPARLRLGLATNGHRAARVHFAVRRAGPDSFRVPFLYRHFLLLSDDRDIERFPCLTAKTR